MDALQLYKLPIVSHVCVRYAGESEISSKSVLRSVEACSFVKFRECNTSHKPDSNTYFVECALDFKVGDDAVELVAYFDTATLIELPVSCIEGAESGEKWFGARVTSKTKVSFIATDKESSLSRHVGSSWTYSFPDSGLQPLPSVSVAKADQLYNALPEDAIAALTGVARSVLEPNQVNNGDAVRVGSVLLCGPSGSGGKTLAQCVARRFDAHLLRVSAASFYAGASAGATREWAQKQVRELVLCGVSLRRCVLLFADLHLLAPAAPTRTTDATLTEAEEGIAEALSVAIRELESLQLSSGGLSGNSTSSTSSTNSTSSAGIQLLVIGYAHEEQQVHTTVRESFRDNVHISLPSAKERRRLMRTVWEEQQTKHNLNTAYPAHKLDAVADSSAGLAVLPLLHLCRDTVRAAASNFDSSVAVSGVSFARVAGLEAVKRVLQETVLWPRRHSQLYRDFSAASGVQGEPGGDSTVGLCAGILLFGPPGTGKTLLPRTLAEELGCSLVNLRISDVVRGEIGTSEKRVVQLFLEAKRCAPSVLFIDEFQALFTSRSGDSGDGGGGGDSSGSSLTATLSGCFDDLNVWNRNAGAESLVTVIASTNEPWAVDAGFLRPGRLDKCVFVGPLDVQGRLEFLTTRLPFVTSAGIVGDGNGEYSNVEQREGNGELGRHEREEREEREHAQVLAKVAAATEGFTGADLTLLLARVEDARSARCASVPTTTTTTTTNTSTENNDINNTTGNSNALSPVCQSDFDHALQHTLASTCPDDILDFKEWQDQYPYLQ